MVSHISRKAPTPHSSCRSKTRKCSGDGHEDSGSQLSKATRVKPFDRSICRYLIWNSTHGFLDGGVYTWRWPTTTSRVPHGSRPAICFSLRNCAAPTSPNAEVSRFDGSRLVSSATNVWSLTIQNIGNGASQMGNCLIMRASAQ
ncbi:hypothetical protein DO64_5497 [Burkholderia pseudomallei]|nr:hypothetical protein DO64_5497 [Burkholderia pseudomallei]